MNGTMFRNQTRKRVKKPLVSWRGIPPRLPKPSWLREIYDPLSPEPAPPMTQIVGIICKEYILVACESQYTKGDKKDMDAQKLSAIKFKNFEGALIAEAGPAKTSNRAVHYIREMAAERIIDSEVAVSQIAEAAMRKVRNEILDNKAARKGHYTGTELNKIFTSQSRWCGLVIAYYFGNKPCLYTIYLDSEFAERQYPYALMGCDDDFARLMLKSFQWDKMEWKEAFPMLIEVLDRVNQDDKHCGGQIRVAGLSPRLNPDRQTIIPAFWKDETVNRIVRKLRLLREKRDRKYQDECRAVMEKIRVENLKMRMKAFEKRNPASTLAIGEAAVKASAEKWNREHPDSPVPIDELLSKNHPPALP